MHSASTLIIGASPRVVIPIARCLHAQGVPVVAASLLPDSPELRSRALDGFVRLPSPETSASAFSDALYRLIHEYHVDMIIPTGDEVLTALAPLDAQLREHVGLACPPPATAALALDKAETFRIANERGIPVPRTITVIRRDELRAAAETLTFPVIIKPGNKARQSGFRIRYADAAEELLAFEDSFREGEDAWLVQEYIAGVGVGIEVLMHGGEPVVVFQHRRLKELPVTGGVAARCVSEQPDPALRDHAVDLLRGMGWDGVAMVEFRQDATTGRAGLMEVNGRYWGSMALSLQCGVLFPWYEWQLHHGERPLPLRNYPPGRRMRWLAGDIERAPQVLGQLRRGDITAGEAVRDLGSLVSDFVAPRTRDALWSSRDPMPAIREFGDALRIVSAQITPHVVPWRVRNGFRRFRLMGPGGSLDYLRLRLVGPPQGPDMGDLAHCNSVLFVCHGNIMRSALAEALLRQELGDVRPGCTIRSAGLSAKQGSPPESEAADYAVRLGLDLSSHGAQPLTTELVEEADCVVAMDFYNLVRIRREFPQVRNRTWLLDTLANGTYGRQAAEIQDPYRRGPTASERTFEALADRVRRFARHLAQHTLPEQP